MGDAGDLHGTHVGARRGGLVRPDGGLDEVECHPQRMGDIDREGAGGGDRGRVVVGRLVVASAEGAQRKRVMCVRVQQVGTGMTGPPGHGGGQPLGRRDVAARGRQHRLPELQRPSHEPEVLGTAQLKAVVEPGLGVVPPATSEIVDRHVRDRLDDGGDRATAARILDDRQELWPARAHPVQVCRGRCDLFDSVRVLLLGKSGDSAVELFERPGGLTHRIDGRARLQLPRGRLVGTVAVDETEVGGPQLGSGAEAADRQQSGGHGGGHLVRHRRVVAIPGVGDRGGQDSKRQIDVAVGVQREKRRGDRGLRARAAVGVEPSRFGQRVGRATQFAGGPCVPVGGGDQAAGAPARVRGQVGRPGHGPCRVDGISHSLRSMRGSLEQGRDTFIRLDRRIGEVPRVAVGLVGQRRGQAEMRGAAFLAG